MGQTENGEGGWNLGGTDIELEAINPTLPCRLQYWGKRDHDGKGSTRTSTMGGHEAGTAIKKAVKRILKVETDVIGQANRSPAHAT